MEDILVDQEQWITVDLGTAPSNLLKGDWGKIDWQARSMILLSLADLIFLNVSDEDIANTLWVKLGNLYQSKFMVNKFLLWKKLYLVRMNEGDLFIENLNTHHD